MPSRTLPRPRPGKGPDPEQLHRSLTELGLSIPEAEIREQRIGTGTTEAIRQFQAEHGLKPTGNLNAATARALDAATAKLKGSRTNAPSRQPSAKRLLGPAHTPPPSPQRGGHLRLSGGITDRRGAPIQGVTVTGYDQDLRFTQKLGQARTSARGRYEIRYTRKDFARADKYSADVFIEVRDPGAARVARSAVTYNAPLEVTIDLVLGDDQLATEFRRLVREVKNLADQRKLAVADLEETEQHSDVAFLSAQLGVSADRVVHLIVAHRLERKSGLPAEFFYGLLRENALLSFSIARAHAIRFVVDLDADLDALLDEVALRPDDDLRRAIDAAIDRHAVEPAVRDKLAAILRQLGALRKNAEQADAERGRKALVELVGQALDGGALPKLAQALAHDHLGQLPLLVKRVQKALGSRSAKVTDETRAALELPPFLDTGGPLLEGVKKHLNVRREADVRALAGLSAHEWQETLAEASAKGAFGRRGPDKRTLAREANRLATDFARRYPTVAFALRLPKARAPSRRRAGAQSPLPNTDVLPAMVTEHPDLDLATVNVARFMKERKIAADKSAGERATIASTLKAAQRLYRLTSSAEHAAVLLKESLTSARAVSALSREAFVARVAGNGAMTKAEAQLIHARAEHIHTGAVLLAGELKSLAGSLDAKVVAPRIARTTIEGWKADFPNLKTLFELQDTCECPECRSVVGPGAYVAAALEFLKDRAVKDSEKSAKDALFARRPDLGDIDLDCNNAMTPIPYIDIVNELLEDLVSPDQGFAFAGPVTPGIASADLVQSITSSGLPVGDRPVVTESMPGSYVLRGTEGVYKIASAPAGGFTVRRTRQTHGTEDERAAAPEYVNEAAYDLLKRERVAFGLPFDAAHLEAAALFAKLAVHRADLMRALTQAGSPSDLAVAAEEIGISQLVADIIVTAKETQSAQDEFWRAEPGTAVAKYRTVSAFLDRTGLTYAELETLLEQPFVNPTNSLFIKHLDGSCDAAQKEIAGLDLPSLDRLHRFLRLWRASGMPQSDVNHAIRYDPAGAGALDSATFVRIGQVVRLARRTGRPPGELLWLYGPGLDGWDMRVYRRAFANPAYGAQAAAALAPALITANEASAPEGRTKLAATSTTGSVALALARTPAEIDKLRELLPDDDLSFQNLGRLYGLSAVARLAHLSVDAFLALRRLSGIDPIAGPAETWAFLDIADVLAAERLDPVAVERLLCVTPTDPDPRIPTDLTVTSILQKLQTAMAAARTATEAKFNGPNPADNAPVLLDLLGRLGDVDPESMARVESLTRGRWNDVSYGETPVAFLDRVFGPLLPAAVLYAVKGAWLKIPGGDPDNETAERNAFITALGKAASNVLYDRARQAGAIRAVVDDLKLDEPLARVVLDRGRLKNEPEVAGLSLGEVLADPALVTPPDALPNVSKATFPKAYAAVNLVAVIGIAIKLLRLDRRMVEWLLRNADAGGFVELDRLPYEPATPAAPFGRLLKWVRARRLDDAYPPIDDPRAPSSLLTMLDVIAGALHPGATPADVLSLLVMVSGWDPAVLGELATRFGLTAADPGDPLALLRLETAVKLLKRVGVGVEDGLKLAKDKDLLPDDVAVARAALRVRYDPADWLTVRKGIENPLRERRRDALVSYLVATDRRFSSALDLFDFLLINVGMSACQPTSRIVQAHGTIQLFVERCLMGVEPATVADTAGDPGWVRWEWMRNYRVWQSSRWVWLYPENWIEPELRDDKSPIFRDLEKALMQTELTDRAAEDAVQGYLAQLDEIAFLEHVACYYDTATGTLHVFARTKGGDPASYYYRRFLKEREWTAWEKVDLDITADQLVPFLRNGRLYLAWPVFEEEAEPRTEGEVVPESGATTPPPNRRLTMKLALSEYSNGTWLPKKLSKDALDSGEYEPDPPKPDAYRLVGVDTGPAGFFIAVTKHSTGRAMTGHSIDSDDYVGSFAVTGCKGYPEPAKLGPGFQLTFQFLPGFKDTRAYGNRPVECGADQQNDLALYELLHIARGEQQLFANTPDGNAGLLSGSADSGPMPGAFKITQPLQMTALDKLLTAIVLFFLRREALTAPGQYKLPTPLPLPLGTLLPFFFEDHNRVYALVPGWYGTESGTGGADTDIAFTASGVIPVVQRNLDRLVDHYKKTIGAGDTGAAFWQAIVGDPQLAEDYNNLRDKVWGRSNFGYRVVSGSHPLLCHLRRTLNEQGIPGLFSRKTQLATTGYAFAAAGAYAPTPLIAAPHPAEGIDFHRPGAYAGYNWELFFHVPFLIAVKLSRQQRFEEAQRWFHYIFDPTGSQPSDTSETDWRQKYWVTAPFFLRLASDYAAQRIDSILYAVAQDPGGKTLGTLAKDIEDWRDRPFRPDVVARSRTLAYQKAVVMKYIGNLIAGGDVHFRQGTMESVNRAEQLYVLAEKLLGPKPRLIPPVVHSSVRSYNELEPDLDLFSNVLLELENLVPDPGSLPQGGAELPPALGTLISLYFCIPPNDQILKYWSDIADRRFKIAHCKTIDGADRTTALFAPRIDPADLVRAVAAGLPIGAVLAGLGAPLPPYRFTIVAQKAAELIQELRTMGQELSQALEKRDAEDLALLRGTLEIELLDKITEMKQAQIKEAQEQRKALDRSVDAATTRRTYYRTRQPMSDLEVAALILQDLSGVSQAVARGFSIAAGRVNLLPTSNIGVSGFGGSPHVTVAWGSSNLAGQLSSNAQAASSLAGVFGTAGGIVAAMAGYARRREEWQFQGDLADKEITQLNQQIEVAKVREDITAKDLANHKKQIENTRRIDAFMHSKFTNRDLFDWMAGEVTAIYFQTYDLAYTMAKKAERCYQHELGTTDRFIEGGSWDGVRKGLGSASRLMHQLKRMEASYLERNRRDYELVKNVSLAMLDPMALIKLRTEGKCTVTIPEALFDLDHAGHYMRRLKAVALTVPCVAGPYTSVSCKLTLLANRYRRDPDPAPPYQEDDRGQDSRFVYNVGGIQSVATSQGQSDAGMFELNFRDERYLPFEGCGAISTWQIEFGSKFRSVDPMTIPDVVLQLRYTAKEGGSPLKAAAEEELGSVLNAIQNAIRTPGMLRCFDLRHELPEAWSRLKQTQSAQFAVTSDMLPHFWTPEKETPTLTDGWLLVKVNGNPDKFEFTLGGSAVEVQKGTHVEGLYSAKLPAPLTPALDEPFTLASGMAGDLEDGYLLLRYEVGSSGG